MAQYWCGSLYGGPLLSLWWFQSQKLRNQFDPWSHSVLILIRPYEDTLVWGSLYESIVIVVKSTIDMSPVEICTVSVIIENTSFTISKGTLSVDYTISKWMTRGSKKQCSGTQRRWLLAFFPKPRCAQNHIISFFIDNAFHHDDPRSSLQNEVR